MPYKYIYLSYLILQKMADIQSAYNSAKSFISDLTVSIPVPGLSSQTSEKSPLNSLYENKHGLSTFQYPRDLAANPARSHYIVFTSLQVEANSPSPEQIANLGTAFKNLGIDVANFSYMNLVNIGQTIKAKAIDVGLIKQKREELMKNPEYANNEAKAEADAKSQLLDSANEAMKATQSFLGNLITGSPNTIAKETIALYIPDTVNVQYSANYSDVSTSEALGKPYMYAQVAASLYDKYKKATDGASASSIVSDVLKDPQLRSFLTNKIGGALGTGDLTGISLNAIGQAFNPQLQVLFSSIGFRTFQFDFTFTPYNQQEAEEVRHIIRTLKYRAAPEITSNGFMAQGLYQKIPDRFRITFADGKGVNDKIHKIGECVLTAINVDYAPMGWATYGDGTPVQTKLTLQFQEIEVVDKNKIRAGY